MRRYLPSLLSGGTKRYIWPDFRGLPGADSLQKQLRNRGDVSPDRSETKMGPCAKIKGEPEHILSAQYNR